MLLLIFCVLCLIIWSSSSSDTGHDVLKGNACGNGGCHHVVKRVKKLAEFISIDKPAPSISRGLNGQFVAFSFTLE